MGEILGHAISLYVYLYGSYYYIVICDMITIKHYTTEAIQENSTKGTTIFLCFVKKPLMSPQMFFLPEDNSPFNTMSHYSASQ